jgi:hypothetical protein
VHSQTAKAEAQTAGYAAALEQLVQASENNREVNVTVGEKTVKFIVVTPAPATAAEQTP